MKRIIYADDTDSVRRAYTIIIKETLRDNKIDADLNLVTNGKELVDAIKNSDYDLIFTDFRMPEMNGLEAIKKIRELGVTTSIYLITKQDKETGQEAVNLGANGYIGKLDDDVDLQIEKALMKHLNEA